MYAPISRVVAVGAPVSETSDVTKLNSREPK
jgi:hypothetical protein